MGSNSGSSNTSQSTQNTMNGLAKGGVSNEKVAGMQQSLQSSLMEQLMPAFGALIGLGQEQMSDNPGLKNFLGFTGQEGGDSGLGFRDRLKLFSHLYNDGDKDEFMAEQRMAKPGGVPIADAMQLPQQPQQGQQAPQMNFNPQMGNLTPEQRAGLFGPQFGGFGRR